MITSTAKKGRPQAYHRTSWGENVQGLKRLADGRWKVSAEKPIKFTEPDERRAVERFYAIKADLEKKEAGPRVSFTRPVESIRDHLAAIKKVRDEIVPLTNVGPKGQIVVGHSIPLDHAFWTTMRDLLIEKPQLCAKMTGIEQISYLPHMEKPKPSPKLDELIETYATKPGISSEEVARCRRFWGEFVRATGIRTIGELSHEHVELFEKAVQKKNLAPKSIKHRYSGIRTVIAHAMKRGKGQADCRKALDALSMLEVNGVTTLDPRPITPADFWKIYKAAELAGDKTFAGLMLFALNAALYSSEVGAVCWSDVDLASGEFVTRRNKTQVPRVAILWPETVRALKAIPRQLARETIFNTCVQGYNRFSVHRDWTKYREAAKVKEGVTFSMIRDAAFTLACRVSLDAARVLAGHRLPGAVDSYVLRAPGFVGDVCAAIRTTFNAGKAKSKKPTQSGTDLTRAA